MANIIDEVDMEPEYGILKHHEGVDRIPAGLPVKGLEQLIKTIGKRRNH